MRASEKEPETAKEERNGVRRSAGPPKRRHALVYDGEIIELDVPARRLDLMVSMESLIGRQVEWTPPDAPTVRNARFCVAHAGRRDFDFLVGSREPGLPDTLLDEIPIEPAKHRRMTGMNGEIDKPAIYPSLAGRSVFITGGGSGIGESLVRHFCTQGCKVAFVDIAGEPSRKVRASIEAAGKEAPLFLPCDLKDIEALRAAIAQAAKANGPISVLVNNAGNDDRHRTEDVTVDYWDDRVAVNQRHQFFAAQAVRPMMKALGGGSIINFGSITWMVGDSDCPVYVTSKSAIWGMTRALARELGPERIRVNCVVPGWVMTERQVKLWLNPEGERQIEERQCLRDRLYPPDLARMVLFLAADDSRMCSSQQYIVDGGWV